MVNDFLAVAPSLSINFDSFIPPDVQSKIATSCFARLQEEWFREGCYDLSAPKGGRPYFETTRQFTRLVEVA